MRYLTRKTGDTSGHYGSADATTGASVTLTGLWSKVEIRADNADLYYSWTSVAACTATSPRVDVGGEPAIEWIPADATTLYLKAASGTASYAVVEFAGVK